MVLGMRMRASRSCFSLRAMSSAVNIAFPFVPFAAGVVDELAVFAAQHVLEPVAVLPTLAESGVGLVVDGCADGVLTVVKGSVPHFVTFLIFFIGCAADTAGC